MPNSDDCYQPFETVNAPHSPHWMSRTPTPVSGPADGLGVGASIGQGSGRGDSALELAAAGPALPQATVWVRDPYSLASAKQQAMTDVAARSYLEEIVDSAPPLTCDQRDRLSLLLTSSPRTDQMHRGPARGIYVYTP